MYESSFESSSHHSEKKPDVRKILKLYFFQIILLDLKGFQNFSDNKFTSSEK